MNDAADTAPGGGATAQPGSSASLARNAFHLVAGQATTMVLGILFSAALGRALGAGDFGLYFLLSSFSTFALVLGDWGTAVLRDPRGGPGTGARPRAPRHRAHAPGAGHGAGLHPRRAVGVGARLRPEDHRLLGPLHRLQPALLPRPGPRRRGRAPHRHAAVPGARGRTAARLAGHRPGDPGRVHRHRRHRPRGLRPALPGRGAPLQAGPQGGRGLVRGGQDHHRDAARPLADPRRGRLPPSVPRRGGPGSLPARVRHRPAPDALAGRPRALFGRASSPPPRWRRGGGIQVASAALAGADR